MQEPIIEVKNVSFYYPPLEVLEDVNLTVKKGEFLAIIGPNGGGKTTLLKIILGLLKPQKGEVYIAGKRVEETQWHNLVAFGKVVDILEKYVPKGKEIAIEGKLTYRSYDDKDGTKRFVTEIKIDELVLLGSNK